MLPQMRLCLQRICCKQGMHHEDHQCGAWEEHSFPTPPVSQFKAKVAVTPP